MTISKEEAINGYENSGGARERMEIRRKREKSCKCIAILKLYIKFVCYKMMHRHSSRSKCLGKHLGV